MRDQYGNIDILTDPLKADTDGDGISDDIEMGEYIRDGSRSYFKRVSDPRVYTVKSNLAMLSLSTKGLHQTFEDLIRKQLVLFATVTDKKYDTIGTGSNMRECIYSPLSNLTEDNITVIFTTDDDVQNDYNYKLEELHIEKSSFGLAPGVQESEAFIYTISARISYKEKPAPANDAVIWRITTDNLAKAGTVNERVDCIEAPQFIVLPKSEVVEDYELVNKIKAQLAVLEKKFIEKFCQDAQKGSANADNNAELQKRMKKFMSQIIISGTDVPEVVCEAFALAIMETWDSTGSIAEA